MEFGWWSIAPPLVAIVLAIWSKQVILSLSPAFSSAPSSSTILVLVGMTVFGLLQTGCAAVEIEDPTLVDAIGDADAATALMWATLVSVLVALVWYTSRRLISLSDGMSAIVQGAKAMLPALVILTLAWSIGEVVGDKMLGLGEFVSEGAGTVVAAWAVPVIMFLAAAFIAFSTGTSWGTFAIMVPIGIPLALATDAAVAPVVGAIFGGGVFGDHCSPISDTTILSSTGASCNHIDHVDTQLPYAITVAAVAAVGFVIAGVTESALVTLPVTLVLLALVAIVLSRLIGQPTEEPAPAEAPHRPAGGVSRAGWWTREEPDAVVDQRPARRRRKSPSTTRAAL